MRKLIILIAALMMVFVVAGCNDPDNAREKEQKSQTDNYTSLQQKQPAESMEYSPTREGLNRWMETWEEPGKTAFVYFSNNEGVITGYYVFEGLPVSYCASLTPPDDVVTEFEGTLLRVAPSMDGVYYSGSQCLQYFGYDAVSGAYIEFFMGGTQNVFITDQPINAPEAKPLGDATIEDVQKK